LDRKSPVFEAFENSIFLRAPGRAIGPIIVAWSVLLVLTGHYQPRGVFGAALLRAGGMAWLYLSPPSNDPAKIRWPYLTLIGTGVALASLTGLAGFIEGSFLTPLHVDIFGSQQTSAMIFDLGVYLAVLGVIVAAFNLLGMPRKGDKEFHVLL